MQFTDHVEGIFLYFTAQTPGYSTWEVTGKPLTLDNPIVCFSGLLVHQPVVNVGDERATEIM